MPDFSYLYIMIDERAYELLCCQLGLANEEKAGLRKQNKELIARLESIEESNRENSKNLIDTINDLKDTIEKQSTTVEHYRKEMELMRKQLEAKDEVNRMLANEISNLRLQLEDSRKHRFGRTSEQSIIAFGQCTHRTDSYALSAIGTFAFRHHPVEGRGYRRVESATDGTERTDCLKIVTDTFAAATENTFIHVAHDGGSDFPLAGRELASIERHFADIKA